MTPRYLFDTGALIAAERRKQRALEYLELGADGAIAVVTPVICIVEWWRGRTDAREKLLAGIVVEALDVGAARAAGEALATLRARINSPVSIDAAVAAHAATTGAVIVTSDVDDFEQLRPFFRGLKVLAV